MRESFYIDDYRVPEIGSIKQKPEFDEGAMYYRADGECCDQIPECQCADTGKPRWRNARFMPRWACRLILEITDIRVQRAQDISANDCVAEGIEFEADAPGPWIRSRFEELWDDTNGKGAWDRNDWVWVVTFKKLEEKRNGR